MPVLKAPDFKRPFELHTDWAKIGLGAVLSQRDDDTIDYVIAYASRSNNKAEGNYSSNEGEALAVVWAVTHGGRVLLGAKALAG